MKVNIGVIGLGIGSRHVESLEKIPDANIAAVADLDKDRATEIADRCGAKAYSDWQDMLESNTPIDAIILATPAKCRIKPIRAICERKLALFCEKPPALSGEEAIQIQDIIAYSGVLNTVGFMYRWNVLATRMREMVQNRPLIFARTVVAWPILQGAVAGDLPKSLLSQAACGGPLIEQAIHFQDVMRYITGDEPQTVQGLAELGGIISTQGRDCPETIAYSMCHASGMLSTHILNWSHKRTLLQLQLVGENLDLTWQMEGEQLLKGTVDGEDFNETWAGNNYFEEIFGFVNAVKHQDQSLLRSSYADACRSLATAEAATKAMENGQIVGVLSVPHITLH